MTSFDADALVDAYIEAQNLGSITNANHPLWWSVEYFMDIDNHEKANHVWIYILRIIEKQPSEKVLGMIGAGPLEDLINQYGDKFIEKIEIEARTNPQFRKVLSFVWRQDTDDEIWSRVMAATGK